MTVYTYANFKLLRLIIDSDTDDVDDGRTCGESL